MNNAEIVGDLKGNVASEGTFIEIVFPEKLAKGSLPYGKRAYTNFVSITWNAESYEGSLMYSVYNNSFNTRMVNMYVEENNFAYVKDMVKHIKYIKNIQFQK